MSKRRKNRGLNLDRRLLILFAVTPIGCLLALLTGLLVTWYIFPTRFVNANISELAPSDADDVVVMIAADFAEHQDLARAEEMLSALKVPNKAQYVSLVAERMMRSHRGPLDADIENVIRLADALGVSTVSMVAFISTPTPLPTDTPPPPPTPTNTPVIPPTAEMAAVAEAPAEAPAEPTATDTPQPPAAAPQPTATPAPPTNTPEPTPTNTPAVDFIIAKQRLLTKDENGGCAGNHNVFVDVIDANGNPLKGVQLGDIWNNPGPVTGHKGDDKPGRAEYDLYKDQGFYILVKADPSAGRPVTSEQTVELSADDWRIGIPRLIEAGYCPDEGTCQVLWNSGVFGVGNNSLCWGHYSWEIVFQRTW
jgi:hypothetical protein